MDAMQSAGHPKRECARSGARQYGPSQKPLHVDGQCGSVPQQQRLDYHCLLIRPYQKKEVQHHKHKPPFPS
ncbi:hypothetical protein THIX_60596 [Thiomonas sp. X19]|nr:hypothetical protein THIX_60596 [Thiomonas sp. X19]